MKYSLIGVPPRSHEILAKVFHKGFMASWLYSFSYWLAGCSAVRPESRNPMRKRLICLEKFLCASLKLKKSYQKMAFIAGVRVGTICRKLTILKRRNDVCITFWLHQELNQSASLTKCATITTELYGLF